MLQTEIKRIKTILPVTEGLLLPSVREEAKQLLGYDVQNTSEPVLDELQQVLAELEIDILDWRDVARYKLEARQAAERGEMEKDLAGGVAPPWPTMVSWNVRLIGKFTGFIPVHVLHKALEIKRRLPQAQIWVEELSIGKDPFLYASTSTNQYDTGPRYYIEVWNEPGFEAAR